jgi:hypothetical protein
MLERDGQHVFRREADGQAIYYLIISGPITKLPVGTYTVEAVVNLTTTIHRHVTIPDSPFTSGINSGFYADIIPTDSLLQYFDPEWIDDIRQRLLLLESEAVRTGASEW